MPLKKKKLQIKSAKIEEGSALQDEKLMSLFSGNKVKIPLLTLNTEQFAWPESFLVRYAKRVEEKVIDYRTGWNKKNSNKEYETTGNFNIQLSLSDGELAQLLADEGQDFTGLPVVQCLVKEDIPIEKFEAGSSLVKLVKPVVMLGVSVEKHGDDKMASMNWNHIKLVCDNVEFV